MVAQKQYWTLHLIALIGLLIILLSTSITLAHSASDQTFTPQPGVVTHIVEPGETLIRIAANFNVSVDELVIINRIPNSNTVYVGQVLIIPIKLPTVTYVSPTPTPTLQPTATKLFPVPTTAAPSATDTPIPPTATLTPTAASEPTTTPTRVDDLGIIDTATPTHPTAINGVGISKIVVISDSVAENIRAIYTQGQALGRNPHSFTALGDSIIEHGYFLERFDGGPYNLGSYGYLQPMINYYAGSFARESAAVRRGLHTWSVLDPMWTDRNVCGANENMLACEIRRSNPSILLIQLGTNDVGQPDDTDKNFRQIVEYAISQGVIPVLGTKADRVEGSDINNTLIRKIAEDYKLPLWDFDLVAATLPGKGLDQDGIHMTTFYEHDWTSPLAFKRGHGVHSLTALLMLDAIWHDVTTPAP